VNKPRAYIEFGPTGRSRVTIKDENGVELDLPVTAIKVSIDSCSDVAKATLTLERVHVTASVSHVDLKVDSVWCRSWKWWRRLVQRGPR
jgi:hypothetical protein